MIQKAMWNWLDVQPEVFGRATTPKLSSFAESVRRLHERWAEHVSQQEGRGGYLQFVVAAAPRYATLTEYLRFEHLRLANALATLRIKTLRAVPIDREALVAERDGIIAAIAEHEVFEEEILGDVLAAP